MDKNDQAFIKGFNSGYLLSQHEPELLAKLLKGDKSHEYMKGLEAGKKQHDKERLLEQLKNTSKAKDKGREI